jgi:hypothetical protein
MKDCSSKSLIVSSCPVHEDEGISKPADGKTVTKSYIHMNRIEIFIESLIKRFALVTPGHGGKGAKSWREFAAVNPGTMTTDLEKMLVTTKFPTPHSTVEFLGSPVCFLVTGVCSITRSSRGHYRTLVMDQSKDILLRHTRK